MTDSTSGTRSVLKYYHSIGSRLGYRFLLGGTRHFGYYPAGHEKLSIAIAQRNMTDHLGQTLALPSGSLVLDAGCGEGSVSRRLTAQFGLRVEGVDLLDVSIERAKRRSTGMTGLHYQRGDYHDLPFNYGTFDGVFTLETFVHAYDYERVLAEFYRVLKPGGRIVLFEYTVPDLASLPVRQRRVYKDIIEGSSMSALPHLVHGSFHEILSRAGYTDVEVEDITPRMMPLLERFARWAYLPYILVSLFGRRRQNPNVTAAIEFNRYRDFKFVAVSAKKPK